MKGKFLLTIVALLIASMVISAQENTAGAEIPTVTGTATDEGVEFPAEIAGGLLNVVVENNRSEATFGPIIARMNDDVTIEALQTAMAEDEFSVITMLTFYGGSGFGAGLAAGETMSYTVNLTPGNYLFMDGASEGGGEETFATFSVSEGDMMDIAEPESDVHIAMVDFGFSVPGFMPAGEQVWHLENVGDQPHETVVTPLPEGIESVSDVLEAMASGEQEEPQPVFSWSLLSPGAENWVTVDLAPGNYVIMCFFPDLNGDFAPHMQHGMIQVFTVQ